MFSDSDVAVMRHVVQGILVPCIFVIGLLGNSVSIYVLTRRRMRCTTNIYLTALAITDIIYLAMALLLSFKHYQYVQKYWKLYWIYYGVVLWLCDACAYISIYIAVCFTIERFIAIRYPLKRQTFCTESLAKRVIAGVALFCLLSTISTAFEHQYSVEYRLIDTNGQQCNETLANQLSKNNANATIVISSPTVPDTIEHSEKYLSLQQKYQDFSQWNNNQHDGSGNGDVLSLAKDVEVDDGFFVFNDIDETRYRRDGVEGIANIPKELTASSSVEMGYERKDRSKRQQKQYENIALQIDLSKETLDHHHRSNLHDIPNAAGHKDNEAALYVPQQQQKYARNVRFQSMELQENLATDANSEDIEQFNISFYCQNTTFYYTTFTELGKNEQYIKIWYFVTLFVFILIPLFVLVTFNSFLIMMVRKSKTVRGEMTNASSMRRPKRKSHASSVSQENRVTVTLIAVVLVFIICQLPWAIYLIVSEQIDIDLNLQAIFGNIFNFLAAINAAANFFLYCVLSDKYRKTVRELITGYRYRQQRNTLTQASIYTNGGGLGASRRSYRPPSASMVLR